MQDPYSNLVFVVSLGSDTPEGSSVSWIDIVAERQQYFHPVGNRWPKEPPNYIAFRYWGRLQSIHHIERFVVTTNIGEEVVGYPKREAIPHFVYSLGPPIRPNHVVKSGPRVQRSARVRVMLDLLLTCETITEALDKTKERLNQPTEQED